MLAGFPPYAGLMHRWAFTADTLKQCRGEIVTKGGRMAESAPHTHTHIEL